ncbi:MAG: hypothetical protein A2W83_01985 [Sulfuricurvum sp. RIFCSPLOWO2_12_43_5]|nr:MAG: hypothetical protein A2W83_01985 [Sulfuricurvum sp. RIFCSPLOWO2_12_43_5]
MYYYNLALLGSPLEPLTYHSENFLIIGAEVEVTLSNRIMQGVVISECEKPDFTTQPISARHCGLDPQSEILNQVQDDEEKVRDDKLPAVFKNFYTFSLWIYTQTLSTWKISLERQIALIHAYLCLYHDKEIVEAALIDDLAQRPEKTIPFFLRQSTQDKKIKETHSVTPKRQAKRI